jgi:hypothetical protein
MRRTLEMQKTCRIRWNRIRCHVVYSGSRLSAVREFAVRKDLGRLQPPRPTCSQAREITDASIENCQPVIAVFVVCTRWQRDEYRS